MWIVQDGRDKQFITAIRPTNYECKDMSNWLPKKLYDFKQELHCDYGRINFADPNTCAVAQLEPTKLMYI